MRKFLHVAALAATTAIVAANPDTPQEIQQLETRVQDLEVKMAELLSQLDQEKLQVSDSRDKISKLELKTKENNEQINAN